MSRLQRDYSYKQYQNPLFQRGSGNRRFSLRKILVTAGVAAVAVGWIWFLGFSRFFDVTTINVAGNQRLAPWEIQDAVKEIMSERRWFVFPKKNLLVLSENDLVRQLGDRFVLESVVVTKKPPRTIDISIKERVSSVLMRTPSGSKAILDLDGTAIRVYAQGERVEDEILGLPTIIDDRDEKISLRERAVHPLVVSSAISMPNVMKSHFDGSLAAAEIHIESKDSHTLRLVTGEGWAIYADALQTLDPQIANVVTILETKVGNDRPKLDYIDVRFGDKIFFKLK